MSFAQFGFGLLSAVTIAGAFGATTLRNITHALLCLVAFFVGVAGCFFMLRADFLGVVQILVYVGAVAVLVVFAIVLTRVPDEKAPKSRYDRAYMLGVTAAALVGAVLVGVILRAPGDVAVARSEAGADTIQKLGIEIMTTWAIPFEVASILLTAALVGAVVVAMEERRGGGAR